VVDVRRGTAPARSAELMLPGPVEPIGRVAETSLVPDPFHEALA
jgi:hypothetical protein